MWINFPIFEKKHKKTKLNDWDEVYFKMKWQTRKCYCKNESIFMFSSKIRDKILIFEQQHKLAVKRLHLRNGKLPHLKYCILFEMEIKLSALIIWNKTLCQSYFKIFTAFYMLSAKSVTWFILMECFLKIRFSQNWQNLNCCVRLMSCDVDASNWEKLEGRTFRECCDEIWFFNYIST